MSQFNFRSATIADLDQLVALNLKAWGQFEEILTADNWALFHKGLADRDNVVGLLQKAITFVCENETQIVGVAYLLPSGNPTDIYPPDWSYIRFLGVDPSCRGHRIGQQLTQLCMDQAKSNNEKVIALHTSEMMDAARHIYAKLGFSIVKEIPSRFGKKYWLYKLDLV